MPRATWNGGISFGLVQIPVELYPGEERRELSFTLLDKRDLSPVGYQRINKKTGELVPYDNIVKGHEHAKGEFVVVTPADFLKANVEATQTIDIQDFVPRKDISPTYFDRPYFVKPKKQGAKAYEVLRAALERTERAGIATLVLHSRQHLAALLAEPDGLVLELLRFSDELRTKEETVGDLGRIPAVTPQEQAMAEQLIEGMSGPWTPEKYHDTYREDLMKLIEEKVAAGQINSVTEGSEPPPPRREREGVVDLMSLLRQSVEVRKRGGRNEAPRASEAATPARAETRSTRRVSSARGRSRRLRRTA